jgi:type II secretory pathway pseudopilin PulG
MQRVRNLVEQPYYQALPQLTQMEADFKPESGKPRGVLTAIFFPSLIYSHRIVVEGQAMRSCVTVAIAATRYRLAHNHQYPETAQALVPEFLDTIPLDPFDGKPLRFKKNEDGSLTFYSIGRDMTDNGGEVESKTSDSKPLDMGLTLKP